MKHKAITFIYDVFVKYIAQAVKKIFHLYSIFAYTVKNIDHASLYLFDLLDD